MDIFLTSLAGQLQPMVLLTMVVSVVVGMIVGAIPGLTVSIAVALAVPVAIFLPTDYALVMLASLYAAGVYGGSVSAILLNAPGTPASAATAIDGHQMARQGLAKKALNIALLASAFGSMFSILLLVTFAPLLAKFALRFGPVEMAGLLLFTFTIVGTVSGSSMIKGLFSAALGILLATIGSDPMIGVPRFTFGNTSLLDGLTYIPLLVGLFAIAEVLKMAGEGFPRQSHDVELGSENKARNRLTGSDMKAISMPMVRGSIIGSFVGLMPGIGSTISAFLAYADIKRSAGSTSKVGSGDIRAVAACESSNNATGGATFIPTLALGIPGDAVTAIILGALVLLGVQPGPLLFVTNPGIVYTIYIVLFLSTVMMVIVGLVATRALVYVLRVPNLYLMPIVALTCAAGSFVVRNNVLDTFVMLGAGVMAFVFGRVGVPVAPLLISFIVTPPFEEAVRQSLAYSHGSFSIFVTNWFSLIAILLSAIVVVLVALAQKRRVIPA
ncbi:tripartite tricarboxylate transporter permease [Oricola sp.]|uniref:tripartite tricarboxylate transporter permease n=1 Tax=Oricola sp. TaxID=1979950 RepID=UPI00351869C0